MEKHHARPIYKKLLLAALAVYIIGTCIIMTDLYIKVGKIEHSMVHMSGGSLCAE